MKQLEDYLSVFDNIVSDEDCDYIVNHYKDSDWNRSRVVRETAEGQIAGENEGRSCNQIDISYLNGELDKKIDNMIFNYVGIILKKYVSLHQYLEVRDDSGYQILRYNVDEKFIEHVDIYRGESRVLTCSITLNDDYEGGEWGFWDREKVFKAKKGSAIIFPSNFCFPHEILPITKGTRYSIVTWIK